jgi:response regulator RpfG family c-di-GMP phosphodiesterase
VTSKYYKYSGELQLQATNEILKLFHKDKEESHEHVSTYFPFLIMQIQQNSCQDVWNDITKVYKELVSHPNKAIATRAMEHSHHYIRYGLSSKMLDEPSCTSLLEWLAKQSKLFYVHLYKVH